MQTYKIQVDFETGDSFGRHDDSTILEMEWTNLAKAKEALARILEHYKWYEDHHGRSWRRKEQVPEPEWHKSISYEYVIVFELDNGKNVQFNASWCGYFERLHGAKIITPPEDGMEFDLR